MGIEKAPDGTASDRVRAGRVLIVEDELNILEALNFVLSRDGWDVRGHGKGDSAVAEVARVAPDLVILDMMLPGRSGLEILRDLRASKATRRLPVLMLTAKGQAKDRDQAMTLGADAFLTKPFSNAELLEVASRLVAEAGPAPVAPSVREV
jgi:DNA-binding response OmpR family regulator